MAVKLDAARADFDVKYGYEIQIAIDWPSEIQYHGKTFWRDHDSEGMGLRGDREGLPCARYRRSIGTERIVWLYCDGEMIED